jgi:hypothetical protein
MYYREDKNNAETKSKQAQSSVFANSRGFVAYIECWSQEPLSKGPSDAGHDI